jgi:hypothetical protein
VWGRAQKRFSAVEVIVAEKIPVQVACRVLAVSESGYYERLRRAASARAVPHVWLTDLITQSHVESRGISGARRVHAELTLGHGIVVGHGQVELLMQRGRPSWRDWKTEVEAEQARSIATDKVNRTFARSGPNRLWATETAPRPPDQCRRWAASAIAITTR